MKTEKKNDSIEDLLEALLRAENLWGKDCSTAKALRRLIKQQSEKEDSINDGLKTRVIAILEQLIADSKWRYDEARMNPYDNLSDYPPNIKEAVEVLETLKQENK